MDKMRRTVAQGSNIIHIELDGIESMPEALRQAAKCNPRVLIISGGDGTVQSVLTTLADDRPFRKTPPLAVLPSGKTNLIAGDLGMRGRPEALFKQLVEMSDRPDFRKHLVRRRTMRLNTGNGEGGRSGLFFGGAGVVSAVNYCRRRIFPLHLPGPISNLLVMIAVVISAFSGGRKKGSATYARTMVINMVGGGVLRGRYLLIMTTSLSNLLFGVKPMQWAGGGDLAFTAVDHNPGAVMRAMKGLLLGRFGTTTIAGVNVRRINEVRITGSDPVTLDGEIYPVTKNQTVTLAAADWVTFVSLRAGK